MEAADGSTNAKVIVQFHDPSGLFDDVAPLLRNRLPLGNLHWKSPNRPLRSIEELDVSLEREQSQISSGAVGARRHQIPGLRQTPFVKVFLLRCDDKDKYKESVRKDLKDWVKNLGFSTSGKSTTKGQERHDAYEYLILHVVLPGTPAASQPKSSKHISVEATESTDSVNSKSKWTGKGTSTILDKLKAEFSSSSKGLFERVAQVRLLDPGKPSSALTSLDIEDQWQDLVEKLKTAILQSFDARVTQYEDDIRERESQRNLPGWNFCTFFILKEGLARGFENVGLLEDAIQIYEELDMGLDAVIQDQAKEDYNDAANALLPYANDLKDTIRKSLDSSSEPNKSAVVDVALALQSWIAAEAERFPWKLERRNYQQMIMTNQVSALDFRMYIFIRRIQIMLRQASMSLSSSKKGSNRQSSPRWDADLMSEICERSIQFMNLAASNLRQDLFAAWGGQDGLPEEELKLQKLTIDNIVASWKWSSLLQTLSECQITNALTNHAASINGNAEKIELYGPSDIVKTHEQRFSTSTLNSNESSLANGTDTVAKDIFSILRIVKGSKKDLAFWAAELFTMMRTIFMQSCRELRLLPHLLKSDLVKVDVVEDASHPRTGILAPSLQSMLSNENTAMDAYKLLTICACQCYTAAGKFRGSRQLLFDLANFEICKDDYEAAADWLSAVPGLLETPPKTSIERAMLRLYIRCLRKINRKHDLLQSLLLDLCSSTQSMDAQALWDDIVNSNDDAGLTSFPFHVLFDIEKMDSYISHEVEGDGASISLILRLTVPLCKLGPARVELECQSRTNSLPSKVFFRIEESLIAQNDLIHLKLQTALNTEGWYNLTCLKIGFSNVEFTQDLRSKTLFGSEFDSSSVPTTDLMAVYIYPRNGTPSLSVSHSSLVDLSEKKKISISIQWGSKDIEFAQLRLKPATSGFRLDLLAAEIPGQSIELSRVDDAQALIFGSMAARSATTIELPYSLDEPSTMSASIRADLKYTTAGGTFELFEALSLMTLLPIGVNVQDIFQTDAIFSRFTFSPSRLVPICITGCSLQGSEYRVVGGANWNENIDVFPKQPASWVVKIERDDVHQKGKLQLNVKYRCTDEAILQTSLHDFQQALEESPCAFASRPLKAHLKNKLQSLWTEQEIELVTLGAEIEMWTYEELDWSTLLYAFNKQNRIHLESWLRQWHESRAILPLRMDAAPVRTLRLLVDPPSADVVVSVQLQISSSHACTVGQPMLAQLVANVSLHAEVDAEVAIEVNSLSDAWLIGGQRKATFSASDKMYEATIILIAQKTGLLMLPNLDIKCRATNGTQAISCEIENVSSAVLLQVRANIQTTTIGLGDGETVEGHWLIDSRHEYA